MNDSVYAPPKSNLTAAPSDSSEAYYVVSPTKFIVMFLTTMGMYQVYWHYQNWRRHQQAAASQGGADADIWPVPRAIFSIFFIHSLLGKVKQHAIAHQRPADFDTTLTATLIVVLMLFGLTGLFVKDPQTLLLLSVVSLILVVPIMFLYRRAQRFINESCGDPTGATNASFTAGNYVWMFIGALMWFMQIRGFMLIAESI